MKKVLPLIATITSLGICIILLLFAKQPLQTLANIRIPWVSSPPIVSAGVYTSPLPTPTDQSWVATPPPTTSADQACIAAKGWMPYENPAMGFSLNYPSDTKVHELSQPDQPLIVWLLMYPSCYDTTCLRTLTVEIKLLDNPQKLPVVDYVAHGYVERSPIEARNIVPFEPLNNGARMVKVAGQEAIRIDDGTGKHPEIERIAGVNMPVLFVPHDDHILQIRIQKGGKSSMMPPFTPPCQGAIDFLDQILGSLQLHPVK